jgi:hypothetical protein
MRERAEKVGGKLNILSRAATGTEIELEIHTTVADTRDLSFRFLSQVPRADAWAPIFGEEKSEGAFQRDGRRSSRRQAPKRPVQSYRGLR